MSIRASRSKAIFFICTIISIMLSAIIIPESDLILIDNYKITQAVNNSNVSSRIVDYYNNTHILASMHQYSYNNSQTMLMSYYPTHIYSGGYSSNGLYNYYENKRRDISVSSTNVDNNNNTSNNRNPYNTLLTESSVERVGSLPHPACLAEALIRNSLQEHKYNNNSSHNRSTHNNSQQNPSDVNQWAIYPNRVIQCNMGPHPVSGVGIKRRGGDDDETSLEDNPAFSHVVLRNVVYFMGEFYYLEVPPLNNSNYNYYYANNIGKETNQYISFSYASSIAAVTGNWPQRESNSITLRRIMLNEHTLHTIIYANNSADWHMQTAVAELMRHLIRDDLQQSVNNKSSMATKGSNSYNSRQNNNDSEEDNNKTQLSPKRPLHLHVPLAYWQPPTDYISNYHAQIEVIYTAFTSLITAMKKTSLSKEQFFMDTQKGGVEMYEYIGNNNNNNSNNSNNETVNSQHPPLIYSKSLSPKDGCDSRRPHCSERLLLPPTLLITSRVRRVGKYKVIDVINSCSHIPNTVEDPDMRSSTGHYNDSSRNCINTPIGRMMQSVAGSAGVYGLQEDHAQVFLDSNIGDNKGRKRSKQKSRLSRNDTKGIDDIFFIDRLLVGNPTHCEPIWGSDAYYAEAVAQDQFLRGKSLTTRVNLTMGRYSSSKILTRDEMLQQKRIHQFFDVYKECQLFLWEYRNFFLNKAYGNGYTPSEKQGVLNSNGDNINHQNTPKTISKRLKSLIATPSAKSTNDKFSILSSNPLSHNNMSAIHKGIRMLPVIPPIYSDSVSPLGNNNDCPFAYDVNASCHDGEGIHIVIASRKGDWAREFNEEEIAYSIRTQLKNNADNLHQKIQQERNPWNNNNDSNTNRSESKEQFFLKRRIALYAAYKKATVRVVKFTGKKGLRYKLLSQLAVTNTTIFIGNHGASLIPSVFLRPNGGVITLSFKNPGFYPYVVFPRWLHWRDIVIDQKCNRRLTPKGKCRWWVSNRNDMVASSEQISRIVKFVEEIIAEQIERPRKFSVE